MYLGYNGYLNWMNRYCNIYLMFNNKRNIVYYMNKYNSNVYIVINNKCNSVNECQSVQLFHHGVQHIIGLEMLI